MKLDFDGIEDFIETMKRGNEVQFLYQGKKYSIFAYHEEDLSVKSCIIAESYTNHDDIVLLESLPSYIIEGKKFKNIFPDIIVLERTI